MHYFCFPNINPKCRRLKTFCQKQHPSFSSPNRTLHLKTRTSGSRKKSDDKGISHTKIKNAISAFQPP